MYYHAIATLPGNRKKSLVNKTEPQMLTEIVIPFVSSGVVSAKWGKKTQSYQVLELRIYKTTNSWNRKARKTLDSLLVRKQNLYNAFKKKADKALGKVAFRVFVIMPIQGERFGTQEEQRIHKEYDERFAVLEELLGKYSSVAIRIDREHPLQDLVARIKSEIDMAQFIIADLTDERPSCYYEAGYADAKRKPTICIASKESVITPGKATKIHFDVHMNVNFFTNHQELVEKVSAAIEKNKTALYAKPRNDEPILLPMETAPKEHAAS